MLRTSRAVLLGVFIGILVMSVMPVSAAPATNDPSGDGVAPRVIPHFGGDDCDDPNVASAATHSFTVVTPSNATFTDTNGVKFTLSGINARSTFNWSLITAGWVVYDVVVKGGTNSNHYDYQAATAGLQTADTACMRLPKALATTT